MRAVSKGLRVPPRKLGLVAGLVRGRLVSDAMVILEHTPRRAAEGLRLVIKSAAANAENNHQQRPEQLRIAKLEVGSGGMAKRMRPAGRGGVRPYRHRLSNVRVELTARGDES